MTLPLPYVVTGLCPYLWCRYALIVFIISLSASGPRPFIPGKYPLYLLNMGLSGLHRQGLDVSGGLGGQNNPLNLPEIKTQFFIRPTSSLVTMSKSHADSVL